MYPEILYALWCIFWAFANHRAMDYANEYILHFVNAVFHFSICIYFGIAIHWLVGCAMVFEGRLFFDISLNVFRKYGIGYVPKNPKSFFDKAEISVFGKNGITPKIIYAVIFIVLILIQIRLHLC